MMMEEARDSGSDELVADLEKIQISGNHLLLLINDVLDLSKIEAGKMDIYSEEFRVPALLEDIIQALKPLVEKNHNKIHIEIESDPGPVYTDMTKLRQTLYNLISNASKFTYDGTITVIARSDIDDDYFSISVKDTGIGMDKTQVDRLFQPFTQADSSTTRHYGGTGLGLTVSKHFCEMLGGTVSVDSALGKGSEFIIRMPRNIDTVKELPDWTKGLDKPVHAGDVRFTGNSSANQERRKMLSKVLVIDDEETVCDLLEKFLSREGFYIRTASNGKDGLRVAEEFRPDVITLDVMMPKMDGWSVLRKLKSGTLTRDIPVIILSVVQDKQMAKDLGASDCLTKPIDWEKLFTVIKQQVRSEGAQPL
jgi:CheY-like chemotaxis protein